MSVIREDAYPNVLPSIWMRCKMKRGDFIQTDDGLLSRATITGVDTTVFEKEGYILIRHNGGVSKASRIQAFDALMLLKPSVLEGLHLRYGKGAWILHNIVSHPLMQFVALGAGLVRRWAPKTGHLMYEWAMSIHDCTIPRPQSGKLWKREDTSQKNISRVALIITGSVAAIKAVDLVKDFQAQGHRVDVVLTKTPIKWGWVSLEKLRTTAQGAVVVEDEDLFDKRSHQILKDADAIIVAPASVNFIGAMTHNALIEKARPLASQIMQARGKGKAVFVAPAMNYKMWEHPITLENCKKLFEKGVFFLGPVEGKMACGDTGFGRMMSPTRIAKALTQILRDPREAFLPDFLAAIEVKKDDSTKLCVFQDPQHKQSILIVLTGTECHAAYLEELVADIKTKDLTAHYVIDPEWQDNQAYLEELTGQRAITDHGQLPELKGMEHIRLPEQADYVLFPFINDAWRTTVNTGRADTLGKCIFFASKSPPILGRPGRVSSEGSAISKLIQEAAYH